MKWISVEDGLPDDEIVLFWLCEIESWGRGSYDQDREIWIDVETDSQNEALEWLPYEVSHWLTPEPPEDI